MKPMSSAESFAIQFAAWKKYYDALLAGASNQDDLRAAWRMEWRKHLDVRASERAARAARRVRGSMKTTLEQTWPLDAGRVLRIVRVDTGRAEYLAEVATAPGLPGPACVGLKRLGRCPRSGRSGMAPAVSKTAETFVSELLAGAT